MSATPARSSRKPTVVSSQPRSPPADISLAPHPAVSHSALLRSIRYRTKYARLRRLRLTRGHAPARIFPRTRSHHYPPDPPRPSLRYPLNIPRKLLPPHVHKRPSPSLLLLLSPLLFVSTPLIRQDPLLPQTTFYHVLHPRSHHSRVPRRPFPRSRNSAERCRGSNLHLHC